MSRRGFTLFEILVALAIVVILVGTMATTISVAFRQKRSAEEAVDSVRDTQTVGDVFVQDIASIPPPSPFSANPQSIVYQVAATATAAAASAAAGSNAVVASGTVTGLNNSSTSSGEFFLFGPFIGDNISLSCYTTGAEPKAPIQGGASYVEYKLAQQPDGRLALVRRADANLLSDATNTNLAEEILVTGVTALQFQYYDGTGWTDSWDSTDPNTDNVLPYAVKMVLTLEPTRPGGMPRVIIRNAAILCRNLTTYAAATAVAASTEASTQSGN